MKSDPAAPWGLQPVPVQAHIRAADVKRPGAAGRSQNRMHVQKAPMEYLLLGRIG
jgi:hypothetical protein